jgi:hypothetical protein
VRALQSAPGAALCRLARRPGAATAAVTATAAAAAAAPAAVLLRQSHRPAAYAVAVHITALLDLQHPKLTLEERFILLERREALAGCVCGVAAVALLARPGLDSAPGVSMAR